LQSKNQTKKFQTCRKVISENAKIEKQFAKNQIEKNLLDVVKNKIDQTLRNKNHAVMFPEVCALANDVRDAVRHLPQGLVLRVNLLADDGNIGMRLLQIITENTTAILP